jgi:hypothetical protein
VFSSSSSPSRKSREGRLPIAKRELALKKREENIS